MSESKDKLLINVHELSKWTGIPTGTLYHWVAEGRLPCVRLSARCLRFQPEAIAAWVAEFIQSAEKPVPRNLHGLEVQKTRRS